MAARGVAGHLDLGHDLDVPRGRVRHDVARLLLRVEAAVQPRLAGLRVDVGLRGACPGRHAPRAHRGELRILLDLQAPGLVVGQVPVQHVELVQRHPVDELLDVLGRLVVARGIEHEPAPGKARRVVDLHGADLRDAALRRDHREQLPQRHGAVEEPRRCARRDGAPSGVTDQRIAFRPPATGRSP